MQQLNINLQAKNNIIIQLKYFMENAHLVPKSSNILETIFDSHFRFDSKNDLLKNLNQHIVETFKCDSSGLISYLQFNEIIPLAQLDLDKNKYIQLYNIIEKLKYKYGFFIREMAISQQLPFLVNTVGFSIANGSTLHKIDFMRADGQQLSGMFNSEVLMVITTSIIDALQRSMQDGVYTINDMVLNNYISKSDEFKAYVNNLIDKSKNKLLLEENSTK